MADTVTLLIEPLPADETHARLDETFREVDATVPALRVGELSTQRGDGIFETIGVVHGHAQEVRPHLERLRNSARICELPEPNLPQWEAAIARAVAALPRDGGVRAQARAEPGGRARARAHRMAARRAGGGLHSGA